MESCGGIVGKITEDLSHLVSIPNFRCYNNIMDKIVTMYINGVKVDLRKLAIYMKIYLIPLYNMIFSSIIKKFCVCNEIDVNHFLEWYIEKEVEFNRDEYKGLFNKINNSIENDDQVNYIFKKIKNVEDGYLEYDCKIEEIFEKWKEINQNLKAIACEKDRVQEYIKKFILDLLI